MKQIILSHQTALKALRQFRLSNGKIEIVDDVTQLLNNKISKPKSLIDIIGYDKNHFWNSSKFKFHLATKEISDTDIIKLSKDIWCVCPEHLLIQACGFLEKDLLCLLLLEFCGTYGFDYSTNSYVNNIKPITSIQKIEKYISKKKIEFPYLKFTNILSNELNFVQDNCASPMEARLFYKLCGPRSRGLYGCKNLQMNIDIQLSPQGKKLAGQNIVRPDIVCKKTKLAIEYDSSEFHENFEQGQKDKRRREALALDGWQVITFVPVQLYDVSQFDAIAKRILKLIGQGTRIRVKNFSQLRDESFELLR